MADLIDRNALKQFYECGTDPDDSYADMTYIRAEHIENAPTIKPEVRHGQWIAEEDADGDISFVCSECGRRLRWDEDFCPSCGSDMRTADIKD